EILTWKQQGQRVILLQGQVLIQQATVRIRCGAAVAFVNLDRLQRTGILHVDLYAEQDVRLDDGTGNRKGQRGLFDLNTRGELRIVSHSKKVGQNPRPDAPPFRRAVAERRGEAEPRPAAPAPGQEETSEGPPIGPGRRPQPPAPPGGVSVPGPPGPGNVPPLPLPPMSPGPSAA